MNGSTSIEMLAKYAILAINNSTIAVGAT